MEHDPGRKGKELSWTHMEGFALEKGERHNLLRPWKGRKSEHEEKRWSLGEARCRSVRIRGHDDAVGKMQHLGRVKKAWGGGWHGEVRKIEMVVNTYCEARDRISKGWQKG